MGSLDNKVAIITGAGSGMGRAAALLFAREGASVIVADIKPTDGEAVAADIRASGGQAGVVQADVSRAEDCRRMVATAVETFGQLNVLVNNAGFAIPKSAEDMTEDEWGLQLDVNLKGVWLGCKYAIPELRKAGGGAIVCTASTVAEVGSPLAPAYSAAKAGVLLLAKSLALAHARENIRVNCIMPGPTQTHFFDRAQGLDAARERLGPVMPMGRMAAPDEMARAMLFLASDAASYITGVGLPVDGGYLAQ